MPRLARLPPGLALGVLIVAPTTQARPVRHCPAHHRCTAARRAHRPAHRQSHAPIRHVARPAGVAISTRPDQVVPALSDAQAASLVQPAAEARPDNQAANHARLTDSEQASFRGRDSSMPGSYLQRIDGAYSGTTDEIIQWAAYKWGLDPQLLRAVASVESWWHMSTVGDAGSSFGLFQIREPYHCCQQFSQGSTAFNADYYGAIIRSYYDGTQTWLNTVSGNGQPYAAGDLWGSVGYWASGRWHDSNAASYVQKVQSDLASQPWLGQWF